MGAADGELTAGRVLRDALRRHRGRIAAGVLLLSLHQVAEALVPVAIDEFPVLMIAAAAARGRTVFERACARCHGTTALGEPSNATPSVANGRLYLRTNHRLACLEAQP